jgi:predicted nuclease of predicted toxin-antitoxin system
MKFKVDENLAAEAAALLASHGHDAVTVVDQGMKGWTDPDLAKVVQSEKRAIVTQDTDFLDIAAYPPASYSGIVVLRLARPSRRAALGAIERLVLPALATTPLAATLWVVDDVRVRVHG